MMQAYFLNQDQFFVFFQRVDQFCTKSVMRDFSYFPSFDKLMDVFGYHSYSIVHNLLFSISTFSNGAYLVKACHALETTSK